MGKVSFDGSVINQGGVPMVFAAALADFPSPGIPFRVGFRTDSPYGIYIDTGSAFVLISGGASGPAAAGTLTGTTLAANVVNSSLYGLGSVIGLSGGGALASYSGNFNFFYSGANGLNVVDITGAITLLSIANSTGNAVHLGTVTAPTFIGALTGNASTVTTNANLTGPITSSGNATSVNAQTGTGSVFVMNTSPTIVTPALTGPVVLTGNGISTARFTIIGTDGNGATLFLTSQSTNGRNWGLYSNGIDAVGEFALYNATDGITAFKFLPTGAPTFPFLAGTGTRMMVVNNLGDVTTQAIPGGGGGGTVVSVSINSSNGFAGTSSGGDNPALTISTSITGLLEGNGTAVSAASVTGSGAVVRATSATLVTPALGTPTALVGTNITGTATGLTAGAAQLVAIANDNSTNATVYLLWSTATSGNQGPTTSSTKLTFNPSTGILTAIGFSGPLAGNASSASLVAIANDDSTNATVYLLWSTATSGNQGPTTSSAKLTFNPSTGILNAIGFSGPLAGNASSASLVAIANDNSTNATVYILWSTAISGNQGPTTSSTKLTFNPSTGVLTSTAYNGSLTSGTTGTTQSPGDNSTKIATTAYVDAADALKAPLASPALTGNPTAPTQSPGDNSTKIATTAYVDAADALKAPLASPALTGNPTAPTQTQGDNSTKIATTAYVDNRFTAYGGEFSYSGASTVTLTVTMGFTVPGNYAVCVTPTNVAAASQPCYVTNKTSTTFQIILISPNTDVSFDWIISTAASV